MKAERINVTESVLQYLTGHIQSGQWAVGSKIPSENQLTERLGVSRASVRVAIQQLIGVGVLESVHGKPCSPEQARSPLRTARISVRCCSSGAF